MSPKRSRKVKWDPEILKSAFSLIENGTPIREAARTTGIPFSSLQQRLKQNDSQTPPRMGRKTIFTKEQEEDMASQIRILGKIFYGCTAMEVRKMAYKYAEKNEIKHNFSKTYEMAGKDWLQGFLKRNQLSVRKAEGTSLNRAASFNRQEVGQFFDLLGNVMEKYQFPPRNIYNVDETGVTSVQDPGKVVTEKGQKRVGSITSGERGQNVTVICAMSATGQFIPPMLIYPRKRHSAALEKDGPREAEYRCSKNGWINEELFIEWLKHFIKFAKSSENDPVLLILDNHASHISYSAYEFCKKHNIVMLSLPPHASHRIQPLDVSVYGPFKNAYKQECNIMMKTQLEKKITQNDIASLVKKTLLRVATISNAEAGFRASGIYPYNPNIFTDDDFLAADVLNNEAEIHDTERRNDDDRIRDAGSPSLLIEETETHVSEPNQDYFNPDLISVALWDEVRNQTPPPMASSPPRNIICDDRVLSTAKIPSLYSLALSSLNDPMLSSGNTPLMPPRAQTAIQQPFHESENPTLSTPVTVGYINYENPMPTTSRSTLVKFHDFTPFPASCTPSTPGNSSGKLPKIITAKDLIPIPMKPLPKKEKVSRKQHATIITGTPNKIILMEKEQIRLAKIKKNELKVEKQKNMEVKKKITQTTARAVSVKKEKTKTTELKKVTRKILQDNFQTSVKQQAELHEDEETDIGEDFDENVENQIKKIGPSKRKAESKTKKAKKIKQEKNKIAKVNKIKKKCSKKYVDSGDDSTSNSEIEMMDLKEDDNTDFEIDETKDNKCVVCGDFGQDNELWYRCIICGKWSHAECTGSDSAEGYICDLCSD